jgi:hypothetical protein
VTAVTTHARLYRYVGPADLLALVVSGGGGARLDSVESFDAWVSLRTAEELAEPFTFVVDAGGVLRVASRRSEHVVCASGGPVSAAGEITFREVTAGWSVSEVTNQSTGYCPDPACWPTVAAALERAGLTHPAGFTVEVVFRRCPACRDLNIVRENDFVCVFCEAELPPDWNVNIPA